MPVGISYMPVHILFELADQPALAGPCLADERHQPRAPFPRGSVEEILDQPKLLISPLERRLEPFVPPGAADAGDDPHRAPGRDRE